MYKCSECGCEYIEKPDFCECGNNEFVIENQVIEKQTPKESLHLSDSNKDELKEETFIEKKKVNSRTSLDVISLTIFVICLILSFLTIFFIWNPKETVHENTIKLTKSVQNIPSIDKIWNNTPPAITVKQEEKNTKKEEKTTKKETKPAVNIVKTTPKTVVKSSAKTSQASVKKAKSTKTNIVKSNSSAVKNTPTTTKNTNIQKVEKQVQPIQKTEQIKNEQTAKLEAENKAKQEAAAKQELVEYKTKLRNTIGHKIDFTKVVGDGSCTVAFKVNSAGALVNRSFAKQSTNITLNDAVYNAVMSTPYFSQPPAAYKNETLYLDIKFYNGNFEISLR